VSHSYPHLSLVADPYAAGYGDPYGERYADGHADPYRDSYADEFAADAEPQLYATDGAPGDESWRLDALCAETDPEAFFPEKGGSTREAKRVCAGCPVRLQCLEMALQNDERFGIWGGLSERERRRVRLQRRIPLSA
jgi:WhiB family redox-sensing transcriptional regulator